MPLDLPSSVVPLFRAAGWPSLIRKPATSNALNGHPATAVLFELEGLSVGDCEAGEECARSDIAFGRSERLEQDSSVQAWELLLNTKLVCIAEVHHFHGALFIDSSGACYQSSQVHEAFSFEGATFGAAVERILLGRKGQPMLLPNQPSGQLYGETITAGHPSLHRYRP
jgi:SUKH-3 immunity protein